MIDEGDSDAVRKTIRSVLNFRDVGLSINSKGKGQTLKPGLLFRSARLDSATDFDRDILSKELGICTVIDLRTKTEHIEAAKKHHDTTKLGSSSVAQSGNVPASNSQDIPGVNHIAINLNGKGFERHLVWQLSYVNLIKLAGYMAFGYRLEGISVLGKNVLSPRGLIGLAKETLDHSGVEIKALFDIVSEVSNYPLLIHCTQGKDRTGLVILLILLLCDVDVESISKDYIQSEHELEPEFDERMHEITSIGLDESFARCPPNFVEAVTTYINTNCGGIVDYLHSIGVGRDQMQAVRQLLLVEDS